MLIDFFLKTGMTGDILPFDLQGIQEMKPGNSPLVDNSPKNNLEYRTPQNNDWGFTFISSAKSDFFTPQLLLHSL